MTNIVYDGSPLTGTPDTRLVQLLSPVSSVVCDMRTNVTGSAQITIYARGLVTGDGEVAGMPEPYVESSIVDSDLYPGPTSTIKRFSFQFPVTAIEFTAYSAGGRALYLGILDGLT